MTWIRILGVVIYFISGWLVIWPPENHQWVAYICAVTQVLSIFLIGKANKKLTSGRIVLLVVIVAVELIFLYVINHIYPE